MNVDEIHQKIRDDHTLTLGDLLFLLIERFNLKRSGLSAISGIDNSLLSRIMRPDGPPRFLSRDKIIDIVEGLEINNQYLNKNSWESELWKMVLQCASAADRAVNHVTPKDESYDKELVCDFRSDTVSRFRELWEKTNGQLPMEAPVKPARYFLTLEETPPDMVVVILSIEHQPGVFPGFRNNIDWVEVVSWRNSRKHLIRRHPHIQSLQVIHSEQGIHVIPEPGQIMLVLALNKGNRSLCKLLMKIATEGGDSAEQNITLQINSDHYCTVVAEISTEGILEPIIECASDDLEEAIAQYFVLHNSIHKK